MARARARGFDWGVCSCSARPWTDGFPASFLPILFPLQLAYQTLDAIDGKQARRTNSSSPLGELFDHGCDALNCAFSTATLSSTLMAGSSWATWVQMWCTLLPFYFTTWEEYHTGVLYIGIINGPTEGLLTVGLVHLYAGIFGPAGLHKPLSDVTSLNPFSIIDPEITIANAMIYSCCVVIVFTVLNSFLTVRKEINTTGKTTMAVAFAATTPMIIQFIFANAWVLIAPEAWHAAPRLFIVVQGFIFSKYTGRLILAHVCHHRYSPVETALVPLILGFFNAIYPVFDQVTFLWAAFFFTFTQYAYMAYTVVTSITTFLGIKCFTIPYKK